LFHTIHNVALMVDRERVGREASPSAGVLDSQSIKAPAAKKRGFDAGKKVTGRKRHIAVDTDGRLLMVNLTTADISDSAGAQVILDAIRKRWPWLKHLFAAGCRAQKLYPGSLFNRMRLNTRAAATVSGIRRIARNRQFENDRSPVSTIVKGVKRATASEYSREFSARCPTAGAA
jgi:hypothetical protein